MAPNFFTAVVKEKDLVCPSFFSLIQSHKLNEGAAYLEGTDPSGYLCDVCLNTAETQAKSRPT